MPIFIDYRTQEDIERREDIAFWGAGDMNRLERNTFGIIETAIKMGYALSPYYALTWSATDEFLEHRVRRVIDRITEVVEKTGVAANPTFEFALHFQTVNEWERSLRLVYERLKNIAQQWRYSGMVVSGGGEFYER